jgi:multiple sugar transport system ATP-binding protein
MRVELKKLHERLGTTAIYVTHDQVEAMTLGDRVVVMRDGVVQQSGGALEIYHQPVNRFVAGFLGSPPMNFLTGTITRRGQALVFEEGSGSLPVPSWARDALESFVGQEVVLGVRPEALSDRQHARFPCEDNVLHPKVTLVQPLGDKMDVYLSTEKHPHLVAHIDAFGGVRAGETLPIYVDLSRVHFFENGENGKAIATNRTRGNGAAAAVQSA